MISCRPTPSDLCWRCRRKTPSTLSGSTATAVSPGIEPVVDMDMRINGGYFILRKEIFDYLHPGDDLVTETFTRAARAGNSGPCDLTVSGHRWTPQARGAGGDASEWQPSLGIVGCVARQRVRASPARADPADTNRFVRCCVIRRTARIRVVSEGSDDAAMQHLSLPRGHSKIVCIAAHPDDVEIAAGATLLALAERGAVEGHWLTLTGSPDRRAEAEAAARLSAGFRVKLSSFRTGGSQRIGTRSRTSPFLRRCLPDADVVLAPRMDDAHQDHRLLGTMSPTVWRDALVLHYEIPKWDGDLGRSNCYVPISAESGRRKGLAA